MLDLEIINPYEDADGADKSLKRPRLAVSGQPLWSAGVNRPSPESYPAPLLDHRSTEVCSGASKGSSRSTIVLRDGVAVSIVRSL